MSSPERTNEQVLAEAKALIEAAWCTPDRRRYHRLLLWARKLLQPLADANVGQALWLLRSLPQRNDAAISAEEFDWKYQLEARNAAELGSASAMFFLGCELDNAATAGESASFFLRAAELGHSYSKWCHGLNLLSGRGIPRNEELGLQYIRQAAEEKFEGAIQFLSQAYASGTYGFPKDEALAATWWSTLKDKSLIRY